MKKFFPTQLSLNMLSGSISMGLGLIVSAIKYPLYIHFLGYEHYGSWLLLSTILTFAQMGLLGITPAIIKLVAEERGRGDNEAIQEYFVTSICVLIAICIAILGLVVLFKWQIVVMMGLEGGNAELVASLMIYMVVFSMGALAYQVLNSVIGGVGRLDIANYSQTALQVAPLILSVPLLLMGKGVISLLLANVFAYLFMFVINYVKLRSMIKVDIFKISSFSWKRLRAMFSFGFNIFSGSMLNVMVLPIAKIVITRSIGVEGVPVIELAYRAGMQIRGVFEVAFRALMPEVSKLSSEGSRNSFLEMKKVVSKAYLLLFFGAIPLYAVIFLMAEGLFKVWLGGDYIPSIPNSFRVMLLATFISLVGVIPYYICMGLGKVGRLLVHHIAVAGGTLVSLGVVLFVGSGVDVVSVAWCFVPGAFLGTVYLFVFQMKTKYNFLCEQA
ncbi:oligosaccharide flippase family protein [Desulfuromonas sp.]|uniref:oligosaccharide flippase family protein n=1 Tax=Desulfuromonas sp. TaxID=892 RepID=UPI0025B9EE10|nr:oligosaccharide flippase family protein [Desulfuromonas sp.]